MNSDKDKVISRPEATPKMERIETEQRATVVRRPITEDLDTVVRGVLLENPDLKERGLVLSVQMVGVNELEKVGLWQVTIVVRKSVLHKLHLP